MKDDVAEMTNLLVKKLKQSFSTRYDVHSGKEEALNVGSRYEAIKKVLYKGFEIGYFVEIMGNGSHILVRFRDWPDALVIDKNKKYWVIKPSSDYQKDSPHLRKHSIKIHKDNGVLLKFIIEFFQQTLGIDYYIEND